MKKNILTTLLVFLITQLFSQTQIQTAYNSTFSGRSITISASQLVKDHHEFGGGLRININSLKHPDDQMNVYYKRLFATQALQYFGVEAFYHLHFLRRWKHVKPFAFYDLQSTYSKTRSRVFLPYAYDVNGEVLYKEHVIFSGPFVWVEQNIGIGFTANLFSNLFMYQKIGGGIALIYGRDTQINNGRNIYEWEFCPLINTGIGYRFEKRDANKSKQ